MAITIAEAKKAARNFLKFHDVGFERLTAKTVSFSDLARAGMVFVTAHNCTGLTPAKAEDIRSAARSLGFRIQYE